MENATGCRSNTGPLTAPDKGSKRTRFSELHGHLVGFFLGHVDFLNQFAGPPDMVLSRSLSVTIQETIQ
jgi:hypothetical protein